MAKIGIPVKSSTLKQQRENAELELIIEQFARAMRNADRGYIAQTPAGNKPRFTLNMYTTWNAYVDFCVAHPND